MLASQSRALQIRFRVTNLKKLWAKNVCIGLAPMARQRRQKCRDLLSLWRNTQRTQIARRNIFFSISRQRLAESVEGLINSLALLVGKLWLAKIWATIVAFRSSNVLVENHTNDCEKKDSWNAISSPFGVLRVLCLGPPPYTWNHWPLGYFHSEYCSCWQANGITACEGFSCTHAFRPSAILGRIKYRFATLWYDTTGIRTYPFSAACVLHHHSRQAVPTVMITVSHSAR